MLRAGVLMFFELNVCRALTPACVHTSSRALCMCMRTCRYICDDSGKKTYSLGELKDAVLRDGVGHSLTAEQFDPAWRKVSTAVQCVEHGAPGHIVASTVHVHASVGGAQVLECAHIPPGLQC